ncbi:hypothetical protein BDV38DRAFT_237439 [Aspergillus pseudotamarii]|uniref:Uncharacterized protein n=1 Tax=Aspergillus pseudotamarii TaxID=132259 RepID=A0A5N6T5Z7_ASPPS|nr:uncharacterized protein BDV38DRAFT_237439 [Aspergillus pseudotamarii]KAE8141744.1 hypothetical protein BDV38DRAFT_237439 [Aspergillus pseudotamarii]
MIPSGQSSPSIYSTLASLVVPEDGRYLLLAFRLECLVLNWLRDGQAHQAQDNSIANSPPYH